MLMMMMTMCHSFHCIEMSKKNRMFLQLLTDGTGDEGVTEDSADVKRKVKGCCFVY